jgi:drug/metabolite transporter (DMT)-like permease
VPVPLRARAILERYGVQAALLCVAAIWGWAFVVVADAIRGYPMYAFLGWRFALAAVAFAAFFPKTLARFTRKNVAFGVVAGVLLSAGYIFQTWGLDVRSLGSGATSPARAAFITGLYVIITPLWQAIWLRVKPRRSTVFGAAIAVVGLGVMSGLGSGWLAGDTLVAICAVAYTLHLTFLGSGAEHDVGVVTFLQLATVAALCGVISLVHEHAPLPTAPSLLWALVLTGVLASAVAFAVQTWAQRKLPPARVAIILVMETAFGGVFGWSAAYHWDLAKWPLGEVLGACIMFAGLVIAEALAAAAPAREHVVLEAGVEGPPAAVISAEEDEPELAEAQG